MLVFLPLPTLLPILCPSQCVPCLQADPCDSITTWAPLHSGLWLGLANGKNQHGIKRQEKREVKVFLTHALLCCYWWGFLLLFVHFVFCDYSFWQGPLFRLKLSLPWVTPRRFRSMGSDGFPAVANPWVPQHPLLVVFDACIPIISSLMSLLSVP